MGKYNKQKEGVKPVQNLEGGMGFKMNLEYELISMLSSGMENNFYEKESEREKRLSDVINALAKKNPVFVAKALIYARTVIGQRSVTHVGSVMLAKYLSGTQLGAKFFSKRMKKENKGGIVYRLDDMHEILSYYLLRENSKSIPNSIKKGFKNVLENSDEYELAKYQAKSKDISLVDIVNLVHPKPNEKMMDVFRKLMVGELKQFNTAEDKNTKSGQEVAKQVKSGELTTEEAKEKLNELKSENWKELICSGKIGYFALLRNLRNIVTQSDDTTFYKALDILIDGKRVRESLVFPHQIDLAFEVILDEYNGNRLTSLLTAINKAYELSIPNLKNLFTHGKTAVVFDTSGSMESSWGPMYIGSKSTKKRPVDKAALIAATLSKAIGSDMFHFASSCERIKYNPLDSIATIRETNTKKIGRVGHGTSFSSIFDTLLTEGKYDRIFVISDMQGSDSLSTSSSYKKYCTKYGTPYVYSINLCGYSTTMFKPQKKVIDLFGYSKDIYEYIKVAEIDPEKILKEINAIEI